MYTAKVKIECDKDGTIGLKSENRNLMRNLKLLCQENKLVCEVTEEVKPRPVKFKGVD